MHSSTLLRPAAVIGSALLLLFPLLAADSFDFYFLVLLWPGAYCMQSKCCMPTTGPPANDFSIRGLWPYDNTTGEAVTKCSSSSFYVKQIENLRDDLNAHWSNLKCPSNNGVSNWKKAWKQYGVCTGLEEYDYFKAALDLQDQVDVLTLLSDRGIVPSAFYFYQVSEIVSAIKEGIGATPIIRCSKDKFGLFQLYEIYICVDKDATTVIECPVTPEFTCSEEVLFAPFGATAQGAAVLAAASATKKPIEIGDAYATKKPIEMVVSNE